MASIYKRNKTFWISYRQSGRSICRSLKTSDLSTAKFLKNQIESDLLQGRNLPISKKVSADRALEDYLTGLKISGSPAHCKNQRLLLTRFFRDMSIVFLSDINESILKKFLLRRQKDKITSTTLRNQISAIRFFINWCVTQRLLSASPIHNVKLPKAEKKLPKALSLDQARSILNAARGEMKILVALGLYAGLRQSEILRLKWEDIDFRGKMIYIHKSKSHEAQHVPLGDDLIKILKPAREEKGRLFSCRKFPRFRFDDIKKVAGIKTTFHSLRHTFATQLVMAGENIKAVSSLMRHSDIKTTEIYLHVADSYLKKSVNKLKY